MNFNINGFESFHKTVLLMSVTHAGFVFIKDCRILSKGLFLWCNINYNSSVLFSRQSFCFKILFLFGYREVLWLFLMPHQQPVLCISVACYLIVTTFFEIFFLNYYLILIIILPSLYSKPSCEKHKSTEYDPSQCWPNIKSVAWIRRMQKYHQ